MSMNPYDVVKLNREMVQIKSYSFMENREEEISQYILDFFWENGIKAYRDEIVPGRYNTIAIQGYRDMALEICLGK